MFTRRKFLSTAGAAASLPASGALSLESSTAVSVTLLPFPGIQPQVVLGDGVLHLIYFTGEARTGNVFYTRSYDFGKRFAPPIPVNSERGTAIATGSIRGAQITVGSGKRVHVAWNAADGKAMFYAHLNVRGTGFGEQRNLMTQTFGLDGGGSIAADPVGNVYVGWHGKAPGAAEGEAGRRLWIAASRDEGQSFGREYPVSNAISGACACCAAKLFADSNGKVYALYRTAEGNVHRDIHLLESRDKGHIFSERLVQKWEINACPMSSMDFIETKSGVLGAWETPEQVYYSSTVRMGQESISPPPLAAGLRARQKYPVLARNGRGETLLAWVEGSAWQRGGFLSWQIFDAEGNPGQRSQGRQAVPVWSFPAVFATPDNSFRIVI